MINKSISFIINLSVALLFTTIANTLIPVFADAFKLTSATLKSGNEINAAQVYNASGCHGQNISPELSWSSSPADVKSFAVSINDIDANAGKGWWHWIVFNIPANIHNLALNAGKSDNSKLPAGAIQTENNYGTLGYGGPCPPTGDKPHHYKVSIYALKQMLPDSAQSTPAEINDKIQKSKISEDSISVSSHR